MAFKNRLIQQKSHCCLHFLVSCKNFANEKNQCSHKLAPQNNIQLCYWRNYLIGNVALKFQLNTMMQTKDIQFFMNLEKFLALFRWNFIFEHAL